MKTRIMSLAVMLTLLLTLSPVSPAQGERHPEIRAAIHALENAKRHLEEAAHDFGGHKADALRATDEAIHQLQVCMEYDKR
jgi:hypothetical protein